MHTAVIVGAGPGLGLSIARKFGRHGMRVALVARKREKLDNLAATLRAEGIEAKGFPGDVDDSASITATLAAIEKEYGAIEVLEYSPLPGMGRDQNLMSALGATVEMAERQYRRLALGAMNCVRQVVPGMLERKRGAILITTSGSALYPFEILTPIGMAMAATRQYAYCLNQALVGTGVYAGTICIGILIQPGHQQGDPDRIAETYYDLYERRDRIEAILLDDRGDPMKVHYDDLVARGIRPVLGTDAVIR
jgi:NAD(P)-dependent dehydrogenase (short-subunit alcohol dehydrogenase family)